MRGSSEPDVIDPSAITLDYLYRQYAPLLRNFCRARLGDFACEADDACHDALLKAHRALPRFRRGPMWPWLATIAGNVCVDIIRKHSLLVRMEKPKDQTAPDDSDEEAAVARERIVRAALESLPVRYRNLIHQHHIDGRSCDEMAVIHGLQAPAVASALARARRALRKAIERVARVQGQWPLPALVVGVRARLSRAQRVDAVHPPVLLSLGEIAIGVLMTLAPAAGPGAGGLAEPSAEEPLAAVGAAAVYEPIDLPLEEGRSDASKVSAEGAGALRLVGVGLKLQVGHRLIEARSLLFSTRQGDLALGPLQALGDGRREREAMVNVGPRPPELHPPNRLSLDLLITGNR